MAVVVVDGSRAVSNGSSCSIGNDSDRMNTHIIHHMIDVYNNIDLVIFKSSYYKYTSLPFHNILQNSHQHMH
jgi:hypothetical protein